MNFLERTAGYITEHYAERTGDLIIVLPNRRAGLFLREHLAAAMSRTYWAPQVFSIQDFIYMLSGYGPADQLDLTFTLYALHRLREGKNAQPLNEFMRWGNTMLNDFNDTDLYLADADELFTYLTEARAISRWNPDGSPLTDFEKDYLNFYHAMGSYYTLLRNALAENKKAFPGMAFRMVAGNMESAVAALKGKKIIFAGLNALTPSEEKIVHFLVKSGHADILWDADAYYLSDRKQEAGRFLRKYLEKWELKDFKWVADDLAAPGRTIHITGIPGNVSQARYAGALLSEYLDKDPAVLSEIAIVLADEKMLVPVLNSLPPQITKFNITMGYPLKDTPVFSLAEAVFSMHSDALKFGRRSADGSLCFYTPGVIRLLSHPYVQLLCGSGDADNAPASRKVADALTRNNSIFVSHQDIFREFEMIPGSSFTAAAPLFTALNENAARLLNALSDALSGVRDRLMTSPADLAELEYVFTFSGIVNRLIELLQQQPEPVSIKILQSFLVQMAGAQTIPFYGEPLEGLQLLGLLETRALSFKKVILLSANEGVIPATRAANSFIPFDIRVEYGLPVHTEKEAIFAYHFYRLLQHCPDVHFIYNTESDILGGGEKSRFLEQLLHELPSVNPDTKIIQQVLPLPLQHTLPQNVITVSKNADALNWLMKKAETGFAPSTLNAYRACPLRFYFKEIAGIDETDEIDETVDSATLGTVIHKVLEDLFKPFAGKSVTQADIRKMPELYVPMLTAAFREAFSGGDMTAGKNLLILKVAALYVQNFLNAQLKEIVNLEKAGSTLIICELEKKLTALMTVEAGGRSVNVLLKGTIDRIDEQTGQIRIVDYKSGKVTAKDLTMDNWELLYSGIKLDKCMQLLMYSWLFYKGHDGLIVDPVIISFRNISSWATGVTLPDNELPGPAAMDHFEEILRALLTEIFDPAVPFAQTSDPENCTWCPYITICNRK